MRLLKKSEIDTAKSQDRQRDILEGLKLAKRIDSLRETLSEEEQSLEKFRVETLKKINIEINDLMTSKNKLVVEVKELQGKKEEALKPLTEEWYNVNQEKERLQKSEEIIVDKLKSLEEQYQKLTEEHKEALKLKNQSKSILEQNMIERMETEKKLKEATEELEKARTIKKEAEISRKDMISEFKQRDRVVSSKERDIEMSRKKLDKEWQSLEKEKIRLQDRKEMFQRNIKRLKQ